MMMDIREFSLFESPLRGRNLIEASAGTGKTFTIAHIYLRLLLERPLKVENILVVTFTRAATNELKERIHALLLNARDDFIQGQVQDRLLHAYLLSRPNHRAVLECLEEAIRDFDEAAIFTIDGFCSKVLLENAFESSSLFDTELVAEQEEILRSIIEDWWRHSFYEASAMFVSYVSAKISPQELFKFLENKVGLLYLRIVPETRDIDCADLERAFEQSYQRVRQLWPQSRQEVSRIFLSDSSGLNRNSYGKTKIPGLLAEMEVYTSTSNPSPVLPEGFRRFTSSEIQAKTKKGERPPTLEFFDACETHFRNHANLESAYQARVINLKRALFEYAREELHRRKQERNIYYFDDLRRNLHQALLRPDTDMAQTVREKYKAALIDEFQDTDPVQYEIFQRIFDHEESTLFLIGDPKQAIYSFRGADIFAYMRAKHETPVHYTLSTNYRSARGLIKAINTIFLLDGDWQSFVYNEIPYKVTQPAAEIEHAPLTIEGESEAPLQIWFVEAAKHTEHRNYLPKGEAVPLIIGAVAEQIARLLTLGREGKAQIGEEKLQPKHIAVLVRENRQARDLQGRLAKVGVHSVLYTTNSLFQTREAEELARILAAVVEPKRSRLLRAALATETMGFSGSELFQTLEDERRLEVWYERMVHYHSVWQHHGFMRMFREMMQDCEWLVRLMSYRDGERRLTNLYHLAEILNEVEASRRLGMSGVLKWLQTKRSANALPAEEHQLRLESDENAVKLITTHMSKGLQYPIVFCPFTWAGAYVKNEREFTFHNDDDEHTFTLDLGSKAIDAHKSLAQVEELAQNLRLLYVALTRAQHRCYLVWGNFGESKQSAPGYLLHHPKVTSGKNPLIDLKRHFEKRGDIVLWEELQKIEAESEYNIKLAPLPAPSGYFYSPAPEKASKLTCRAFEKDIDVTHRIASYSSLIAGVAHGEDLPDHDAFRAPEVTEAGKPEAEPDETSFLAFPKGAKTGTFIHSLLEDLDFTESDARVLQDLIENKMQLFGFDTEWLSAVESLVGKVRALPLGTDDGLFCLSQIPNTRRLNELEFYFPVKMVTQERLVTLFEKLAITGGETVAGKIRELTFTPFQGFMKGFIDLIIEHDNRYYIVDWKSNYLGDTLAHYNQAALKQAMLENLYFLQYHIYAVALNQYLKLRVPEFDYEEHFGGVMYIFLRGIEPQRGPEFGIYYDRPARERIVELSRVLLPEP